MLSRGFLSALKGIGRERFDESRSDPGSFVFSSCDIGIRYEMNADKYRLAVPFARPISLPTTSTAFDPSVAHAR